MALAATGCMSRSDSSKAATRARRPTSRSPSRSAARRRRRKRGRCTVRRAARSPTQPTRAASSVEIDDPFAPVPEGTACTQIYGGPEIADVSGTFNGQTVDTQFSRGNGCELERWKRVGFLFPASADDTSGPMALRVTHCPVNLAGVGWTNVQALRKRGVDARLVVFNTQPFRPDQADWDLKRPRTGLLRQQLVQWRAFSKLLPQTDIFHFYFGLTLVPKSVQFPILRATRRKSLFHFLGADIRERPKEQLMYGLKADARVVGSFAALRFIPYDAEVLPPGIDLTAYDPVPPVERERVRIVHAPSNKEKKGTEHVIEACKQLPVDLDVVHGVRNEEALERYKQADIVVDQVLRDWHGVFTIEGMALGKPVVTSLDEDAVRQTEEAFGVKVPIVRTTKDDLVDVLRPLVESFEERKRLGEAGRAYVEEVHDIERMTDRLLDLYGRL